MDTLNLGDEVWSLSRSRGNVSPAFNLRDLLFPAVWGKGGGGSLGVCRVAPDTNSYIRLNAASCLLYGACRA